MDVIENRARARALFICFDWPYPSKSGLHLRQRMQIEALALDYDVTVAVKTPPAEMPAEVPAHIKISVDAGATGAGFASASAGQAYRLDKMFPTLHLGQAFDLLLSLWQDHLNPVRSYLKNSRRAHYFSCLQSCPFDLVWVSRLETAWAIGQVGPIPSVLDMDDFESSAFKNKHQLKKAASEAERSSISAQAAAISRIERETGLGYDLVTLSALPEMEQIGLPNGRLLQNCAPPDIVQRSARGRDSERIIFVGTLEYLPNAHGICWFLETVWPRLKAARPAVSLDIVGACFNANMHPRFILPPGVRFHGFVEDTASLWEEAALLIVPIFAGGGTRIKIMEAWSRGVPIVATPFGIGGLEATDGVHALIAETPDTFAERCAALLSSPALQAALAAAGKDQVRSKYSRESAISSVRLIAQEARAGYRRHANP